MELRRASYSLGILALLSGTGHDVTAQEIARSQHGTVTQRIGETAGARAIRQCSQLGPHLDPGSRLGYDNRL
jgi:hypothetical protein